MGKHSQLVAALAMVGCAHHAPGHVDGGVLGRVVVYRNGVAFYERHATVIDGQLTVHVPRDRVDDFLKSLTVVDPETRKPLSVTIPRKEADDGSYLTMTLETAGRRRADVLLTYVTEAPAWKPSYRVVVGAHDKVMLEGWAIVDNTTTEDWKGVLVGVGASSALAFRYDLWSVRSIDRDLLAGEDRFATAPPAGVSPYAEATAEELVSLDATEVRGDAAGVSFTGSTSLETSYYVDGVNTGGGAAGQAGGEVIKITDRAPAIDPTSTMTGTTIDRDYVRSIPGRTFENQLGAAAGSSGDTYQAPPPVTQGDAKLAAIVAKVLASKRDVVIEVHGALGTDAQAAARGAAVKNRLVDDGVPAPRIHVVPRLGAGEREAVRVLAVAPERTKDAASAPPSATAAAATSDTPVGESHFMADRPMTVRAGTSAMVAMVHGETTGGVVYLYDPISDRGDQRFAFKAVRLDNPTDDTLEPGPVTVYGDGRFIGEGITEPVPPHASVVVPFAQDKQIVIERNGAETDRIAKLVTVQRGVITAELQHRRQTRFTVTSRLPHPAKVYLRHRLESGWTLVEKPSAFTKVGDSQLFEIDLRAGETRYVTIAEATPVQRTFELASEEALGMMKVFIDEPDASPQLKAQIEALLATHRGAADLDDRIATLREQRAEYRTRTGELHAQLVTLKAVRTGGDLMTMLRAKLAETSERIQKTTIALVDAQEQLMLARVKFQNQLVDLRIGDATVKSVTQR